MLLAVKPLENSEAKLYEQARRVVGKAGVKHRLVAGSAAVIGTKRFGRHRGPANSSQNQTYRIFRDMCGALKGIRIRLPS